jgi:hypothetical protein
MHVNTLRQQFTGSGSPYSLARLIAAYEKQRRVYFVSLISPRILLSDDVQTFEDLVRLSPDFHGQMTRSEVLALTALLQSHGVALRFVDKHFRHAALAGSVPSLVSVPTTIVNGQNFITIKDKYSGAEATGGSVATSGTVIIGVALNVPPPNMWLVLVATLGVVTFPALLVLGAGVLDIMHDSPPAPVKASPTSSASEVDSPENTGPDGGDQDTIEIPNAVAIGDAPNGLDVDGLVADLGDLAVDFVLSDLPIGWDPDAGVGLPGLGAGDLGGSGDDSGGVGDFPV